MSTFSVYEDLSLNDKLNRNWLEYIYTAAGIFDEDKFSMYNNRSGYGANAAGNEYKHLEMKQGKFNEPSFILIANKIVQLIMVGSVNGRTRNVCFLNGDRELFINYGETGLLRQIKKNISAYDYLQESAGLSVYYFPYKGMKQMVFFSFVQIGKNEYIVDSVDGMIKDQSQIRNILDNELLKMVIHDCYN